MGVQYRKDNALHAGPYQRIGAGGSPTMVRAGLEGNVYRRSASVGSGLLHCHDFGVGAAWWLSKTFSNNRPSLADHAPHVGVRACPVSRALGQPHCTGHHLVIEGVKHGSANVAQSKGDLAHC